MKKKRLSWAREHQTWTTEQWKKVIFSNESRFCLFNDGCQKVVRHKGEQFHPACVSSQVKFPPSVMVYGSMCTYGVGSLCFIHRNVNSQYYCEIMADHLIPTAKFYFTDNQFIYQQDGAPCHRAKNSMAWFEEQIITVLKCLEIVLTLIQSNQHGANEK
uniref:Tc1-like transposase DDE domain-containing protein n=1 Tax=Strigamia maritima TaxID=126957 RepID=T1IUA6_STRMM